MSLQFIDIFKDREEKFGLPTTIAGNDTTPAGGGQCLPVTSSNDAVENFSFTVVTVPSEDRYDKNGVDFNLVSLVKEIFHNPSEEY